MKNSTNIVAIVQARMGSKRLPGKSLEKVYKDFSLLEMVLLRVKAAKKLKAVILATSENKNCNPLEKLAERLGVFTIRGSETDVLSRFIAAIDVYQPNAIVRVCADNPLISPEEIDHLIVFFQEEQFDYATNSTPDCGLPDGLGCEIVKADLLEEISKNVDQLSFREHVTSFISSYRESFNTGSLLAPNELYFPEAKLDIDTHEDLRKMRDFCKTLPERTAPYWTSKAIVEHAKAFKMMPL